MNLFLRLKHWQLFLLLLGIPLLFQFAVVWAVAQGDPALILWLFPLVMILFSVLFFGWLYTLGTHLHARLPATARMSLTRFKIFLLIPAAYLLLVSVGMSQLVSDAANGIELNPMVALLILPLHLFSIFCIFHSLYFCARALRTVELQRPLRFGDFAGEFFLLWFYPVGIWLLQPRINRLFDVTSDEKDDGIADRVY